MSGPVAPSPRQKPRQDTPAFARDLEAESVMRSCTRFLGGNGPRTVADLLTLIPTDTEIDYYGVGGVVHDLETKVAELLGKPAAIFLPSGTMAQQIVLRVHGDQRGSKSIAFHPACHLDTHEERAYQRLHDLFAIPVGPRNEPLSVASLDQVHEPIGALLIELPQRDLGGVLPTWSALNAQVKWARDRGAAVHLDGARLWESTPYYKKTPAEIAALFDSVYVSFYKGLGAISGCCVAGEKDLIDEVSTWRTRHGGRLFGLWPYAAAALTALDRRLPLMPKYYRHAVAIGKALHDLPGVEVLPYPVQSPMMHLRLSVGVKELRRRALAIAREDHVWTIARPFVSEGASLQRIEFTVGDATLKFTPDEVRTLVERLVQEKKATTPTAKRAPSTKRASR
ncbi:MAG TPA: beta-eliminating lyase-related protein [Acidimicrobiales bacterium]|nr:beta-eliminating lyase-related protein [Acidimicrobiales bacterium]